MMMLNKVDLVIQNINRAIKIFGSVIKFAKAVGVSRNAVYIWRMQGFVPREYLDTIFTITNGKVLPEQICKSTLKDRLVEVRELYATYLMASIHL